MSYGLTQPENTRRSACAGLKLGQRLRRWPNIKTAQADVCRTTRLAACRPSTAYYAVWITGSRIRASGIRRAVREIQVATHLILW